MKNVIQLSDTKPMGNLIKKISDYRPQQLWEQLKNIIQLSDAKPMGNLIKELSDYQLTISRNSYGNK